MNNIRRIIEVYARLGVSPVRAQALLRGQNVCISLAEVMVELENAKERNDLRLVNPSQIVEMSAL